MSLLSYPQFVCRFVGAQYSSDQEPISGGLKLFGVVQLQAGKLSFDDVNTGPELDPI